MEISRTKIDSIPQLFKLLKEVNELKNPIYRGHSSTSYKLNSSAYRRMEKKYADKIKIRKNLSSYHEQLIEEFKSNKYHQNEIGELTDLEILAKLQHYGAATCFLDFSRNIAVALWFACSSKEDRDGRLYILKDIQDIINYKIVNSEQLKYPIDEFYKDIIKEKENELVKHFMLWEPPYLSERILQQDSIFLFSKKEDELDNDEFLFKIDINKKLKKEILEILNNLFNINKKTIYKDFHGFALSHAQNELIDFIDDGEKYFDMANQYFQNDNFEKAEEYYKKAENDLIDKEMQVSLYISLATIKKQLPNYKNLQEALKYQKKAILIIKEVLDEKDPKLATSYNNLSSIYRNLGGEINLQEALKYQKKAMEIREDVLNEKDPSLATGYENLSSIYKNLGGETNLQEALGYQKKAVEINEEVLDEKDPSLAISYNNLSLIYQDIGGKTNLQEALGYQKKALEINEEVLDTKHPNLATSYNNLSSIYQDIGGKTSIQEALRYQKKDVEISEDVLDTKHPDLAISYNNLSSIYKKLDGETNLQEALKYQKKAVKIVDEVLYKDHHHIKVFHNNLKLIEDSINVLRGK